MFRAGFPDKIEDLSFLFCPDLNEYPQGYWWCSVVEARIELFD
jgi:hypothetical protein